MNSRIGGVVRRVVLIGTAAMLVGALAGCGDPSGFDRAKAAKVCGLEPSQIKSVGSTSADAIGEPRWIMTDQGGVQYRVTRTKDADDKGLYYWACR